MKLIIKTLLICITPILVFGGCTTANPKHKTQLTTLKQLDESYKQIPKKIALALVYKPTTLFGGRAADLYLEHTADAIKRKGSDLRLLTIKDDGYPEFMKALSDGNETSTTFDLAQKARGQGLQSLVTIYVTNIRSLQKKTGMIWFRKMRYYLLMDISVNLIDPFTASKLINETREHEIKLDLTDYEGYEDGNLASIEKIDEVIKATAAKFARKIANVMEETPWKCSVLGVKGNIVHLESRSNQGLEPGDRLVVFEARRIIKNNAGDKFIVPGYRIANLVVQTVGNDVTIAKTKGRTKIKKGDFAIAIK
ncbi:MAG: hypothetical protein GY874_11615 [Desulfobacteraceae bacterium]|nr:hypothetical protein [Desulfobacteraceae bacterium]